MVVIILLHSFNLFIFVVMINLFKPYRLFVNTNNVIISTIIFINVAVVLFTVVSGFYNITFFCIYLQCE